MAMLRCPKCQTEIRKPVSLVAIVLGILGFLFVGGTMLIIVCLAAIAAIGTSASEEFDRVSDTLQAEATNEVSFHTPNPLQTESFPAQLVD